VSQATDLLTLEDAISVVRRAASHTQHVGRLEAYVSAISQKIDELVGPVVQRTVTGEQVDGCGGPWVHLRRRPVVSITSVTSYERGTPTVLTAETLVAAGGYVAEKWEDDPTLLSGRLWRRSNWLYDRWTPGSTVVVTYVAGRYATTAAVAGTRFWQAAALTLKSVWRAEESTTQVVDEYELAATAIPGFLIPNAARDLLADQLQHPNLVAL
jgi:hypothetical protein